MDIETVPHPAMLYNILDRSNLQYEWIWFSPLSAIVNLDVATYLDGVLSAFNISSSRI